MMRSFHKQPRGAKTEVKLQCFQVRPMSSYGLQQFPKRVWKYVDKEVKVPKPVILVSVTDIDNPDKLGWVIRRHYGFGTFLILFWNNYNRNKTFSKKHICFKEKCEFFNGCRRHRVYKKGESCRDNPKLKPNWTTRAKVTITPHQSDTEPEKDYKAVFDKQRNRMYFMWFWQTRNQRGRERE